MKRAIVVIDGATDHEVKGTTPLREAQMPYLDWLCQFGTPLRVKTIPDGRAIGSDYANMTLLGLDEAYYPGRSMLEMLGCGHPVEEDEFTYRINMVTYEPKTTRLLSMNADGLSPDEHQTVFEVLRPICEGHGLKLYPMKDHMYLLKGIKQFQDISGPTTLLGHDLSFYYKTDACYEQMANQISKALVSLPINMKRRLEGKKTIDGIWIWGKGKARTGKALQKKPTWAVITGEPVIKGIARLAGCDLIHVEGADGSIDTNLPGKAQAMVKAFQTHDLVYCHIEAPDTLSHRLDPQGKIAILERIDEAFIKPLIHGFDTLDEPFELFILPDHGTSSQTGEHILPVVPCLRVLLPLKQTGYEGKFNEQMGQTEPIYDPHQWRMLITD